MHFSWHKNKPAFLVECDFDFDTFKITVRIQRKPNTDRLSNGLFGFSFLNSKMLRVCLDNFSFDNFVIGINRIESSFNRAIRSLKNDLALFVSSDVLKNMSRGVLQPILRPAGFSHL